jgi:hypothetical protein
MQRIYSKDECAPDAQGAVQWLNEHLGRKPTDLSIVHGAAVHFGISAGDGSTEIFEKDGVFYVLEFSCGVYEDVLTATREEVGALIEKLRDQLLGVKDEA